MALRLCELREAALVVQQLQLQTPAVATVVQHAHWAQVQYESVCSYSALRPAPGSEMQGAAA